MTICNLYMSHKCSSGKGSTALVFVVSIIVYFIFLDL